MMVGAIGAGTAAAQQLSRTFGYTCTSPVTGNQSFTAEVTANVPDTITVGQAGRAVTVNVVAKVNASFTQWMANAGMSTIEGTVDASAHVAAPHKQLDIAVPFRMTRTTAPASGPFKVRATAGVTTPTFSHPGRATVTTGGITLHLLAKNASGTAYLQADAPCTLNAGQSNVVTSFDITQASSAPSPTPHHSTGAGVPAAPSRTTGSTGTAPTGQTTGSKVAAAPNPATPKTTKPGAEPVTTPGNPGSKASGTTTEPDLARAKRGSEATAAVKPSATGHATRDLILLAVGVLLVCAAAYYLGTRRRNKRRTSDDGAEQRPLGPRQGVLTPGVEDAEPGIDHQKVTAAAPRPPEHDGRKTPRGRVGRRVAEGRNLLLGRHMPNRADHRAAGTRTCGDADSHRQLPDSSQGEGVNAEIHEEHATGYARQA
ncbi:DUF6801 domain-containing protein [Streptomyces sp. NPDC059639]|uniref:DUF6801 domain-containing protein n=1 Tax=Streptomyces sp. NPDC059639 TaxID=3346891 RepID=UPI00367733F2